MDMIVQVRVSQPWGTERIYPQNRQAEIFSALMGKKTLDRNDLALIRELGYSVQVVQEEVRL